MWLYLLLPVLSGVYAAHTGFAQWFPLVVSVCPLQVFDSDPFAL